MLSSNSPQFSFQEKFMQLAILEAQKAVKADEVPIGAVLVYGHEVIARAHNEPRLLNDPTAHAEMLVLREGAKALKNYRLNDCVMYVTLEPCPMCLGAMLYARISHLYFGAYDKKLGAVQSVYQLLDAPQINHTIHAQGGLCEHACKEILQDFFKNKRKSLSDRLKTS
jgi:tRNA(adenine34) deaminase